MNDRGIRISDARVIGLFCPGLRGFNDNRLSSDPEFIITSDATMVFSKKEGFIRNLKAVSPEVGEVMPSLIPQMLIGEAALWRNALTSNDHLRVVSFCDLDYFYDLLRLNQGWE